MKKLNELFESAAVVAVRAFQGQLQKSLARVENKLVGPQNSLQARVEVEGIKCLTKPDRGINSAVQLWQTKMRLEKMLRWTTNFFGRHCHPSQMST